MTQARDLLPLRVQLVPMQLPEAPIQPVGRFAEAFDIVETSAVPLSGTLPCGLLLYPGEPSEILVKLENIGSQTLQLNVGVEGNFPASWYRLRTEGNQIPPGGKIEAVLYFRIPQAFFEREEFLQAGQSLLLDYQGRIYVSFRAANTTRTQNESASFTLYIRPRSLYLDFLPELYREVDFIGRLLKVFEQSFEPAVQALDALWAYLDPLTAPEALLPFLAYWVGWKIDPRLSRTRQRYLIRYAIELYRWRGTRRGLRFYLYLYTNLPLDEHLPEAEKHISIQEVFTQGLVMGQSRLGEDTIIGGGQPYHFIVKLRPPTANQIDERLVRQIVEQEKPAFCTYELYIEPTGE
ncbi:phage tail protein [Phormidium sp. CCY1219]|uniref:phage tail protein n=1 Tax=Phormidium sp. CCY1219 TaxID=2886104 RepID=UPI002D1F02A0|nr:phage tail protein [Phormidium sp. CCY1219]MEB3828867.1 phage tail protein [Phormidium sp. CCY1219]